MDKTHGVGMIGYGFIGKVHAYAYRTMPFFYDPIPVRTRLVGVCTSRQETAQRAKAHGGFDFATTDLREILACDDIDIVNICTPNVRHKEAVIAAAAAGKHVYCDKPLALDAAEAREILNATREYEGIAQMTFQYRFVPALLRAKQLIEDGLLGRVFSFRCAYLHSGYIGEDRPITWRLDRARGGGGALFDLGSHILDLMRHLLGEFTEVLAVTETFIKERPLADGAGTGKVEVDDLALLTLRTADGAVGTLEASRFATGANDDLRLEIHGSQGAIRFSLEDPNWLDVYDVRDPGDPVGGRRGFKRIATLSHYPKPAAFPPPKSSYGWLRGHVACLHNFLTAIARREPTHPDLADGARVQEIMDAAYESAKKGGWVEV